METNLEGFITACYLNAPSVQRWRNNRLDQGAQKPDEGTSKCLRDVLRPSFTGGPGEFFSCVKALENKTENIRTYCLFKEREREGEEGGGNISTNFTNCPNHIFVWDDEEEILWQVAAAHKPVHQPHYFSRGIQRVILRPEIIGRI